MPRLPPVSWKQFVRRLRTLGFEGPFPGGRHPYMQRGTHTVTIPNSHDGDISSGFLLRLLRQAEVTREEWETGEGHTI